MPRYLAFFTATLLYTCSIGAAMAFGITGVDVKFISDSNPAKAELTNDIESTSAIQGRVTANLFSKELGNSNSRSSGISINGSATYEHNTAIVELGESHYRMSLDWFTENKTRRSQPFIRLSAGVGYLDSETQIRDGALVDFNASINFQPTQFFDTTFGTRVELREAETDVFDSTKGTLFATANFSPFARLVLRSGLRFVVGDEISTATPTLNIVNNAQVIESDPAFGGVSENRFAYLVNANSVIAELGLGYEISASTQANVLYRYITTEADGDIGYDRHLLELTFSLDL